jgi:hypothetical protein
MRNQASLRVFDYWTELKGSEAAPVRTDINPASLRHFLPHLFIAALDDDQELVFRLAGTRICDVFGREFRGTAFGELWLEHENRRPIEIVRNVIRYERPALLDVFAANGEVLHPFELLVMPVRPAKGQASDRVLGALIHRTTPLPEIGLPVHGLVLDNWMFLTEDGERGHSGPTLSGEGGVFAWALKRLLPSRFLS